MIKLNLHLDKLVHPTFEVQITLIKNLKYKIIKYLSYYLDYLMKRKYYLINELLDYLKTYIYQY